MNSKNNIFIDIITEFKGQANIKAAKNDILGLTGAIKGLAAAYSVEQVVSKSLEAFKNEQAAVAGLTNSLKNLGTSYSLLQPIIDKQAEKMLNLGFTDSSTLDALTKLTTALGNPAKALDVLGVTADLARYKNQDLATTADQVAKAVIGNSRAFADLGLKADSSLTPLNAFQKLLDQAKAKAGGAADAYAKTLGGALDIAAAKADNASAKLGKALAPSIQKLAEFASTYLVPVFSFLADHVTELVAVAGALLGVAAAIKAVGIASSIAAGEMAINPLFAGAAALAFVGTRIVKSKSFTPVSAANPSAGVDLQHMGLTPGSTQATTAATAKAKKVETTKAVLTAEQSLAAWEKQWAVDQAKADAAALAAKNKQLALDKAAKQLKDAGKVIDLQAIEIQAALIAGKNTLSDRDKLSLQLQMALLDENAKAADELAKKLAATKDNNPFNQIADGASKAKDSIDGATNSVVTLAAAFGGLNAVLQSTRLANPLGGPSDLSNYTSGLTNNTVPSGSNNAPTNNVTVNVNGAMTHDDLVKSIQDAINNNNASGYAVTYDRSKLVFV